MNLFDNGQYESYNMWIDLDELRDKAADRTEWQWLVEKLGETTDEVDDSDESTTEAED